MSKVQLAVPAQEQVLQPVQVAAALVEQVVLVEAVQHIDQVVAEVGQVEAEAVQQIDQVEVEQQTVQVVVAVLLLAVVDQQMDEPFLLPL